MTEEQIRRLVKIVEEANIAEIEVSKWGRKVKITKIPGGSANNAVQYTIPAAAPAPAPVPAAPAPATNGASEAAAPAPAQNGEEVCSPMVGTFYRAPAPDADPYVKVGDTIQKGQVICIVEAMKLMNEVEAEFSFKVLEILVENGQPVEYNQPLLLVEKL